MEGIRRIGFNFQLEFFETGFKLLALAFDAFVHELPRCYSKLVFEAFAKVGKTAEANAVSNLCYIISFVCQHLRGTL